MSKKLVIFVRRGNIGRSPFAEAVLKQELAKQNLASDIQVTSRGVQGTVVDPEPVKFPNITYYEEMYANAQPALQKFGIDLSRHVSKPISDTDAEQATILLAVDGKTLSGLKTLFPEQTHKMHLLAELVGGKQDVTDPELVSGEAKHEQIFTQLHHVIHEGMPKLLSLLASKQ